jgi:hypothetical protein
MGYHRPAARQADLPAMRMAAQHQVEIGMRGMLVQDDQGAAYVYMLTEPATHYYEIMCRHNRMPALIDQRI